MAPISPKKTSIGVECAFCLRNASHLVPVCDHCVSHDMNSTSSTSLSDDSVDGIHAISGHTNGTNQHNSEAMQDLNGNHIPDTICVKSSTKYILFGTYMTSCPAIELSAKSIKFCDIKPNTSSANFRFNITVPFGDIRRVMYCPSPALSLVLMEVTEESNEKIQVCMHLGHRFDVKSQISLNAILYLNWRIIFWRNHLLRY
ncbi:unnamed protein product [Medioppia subpectinata]|uniref:Uncharacterized protein n=1 Tax=Medioppia subpectinata TaxID=1979941 RepID=A0A7R9L542_9ACAR|nr:unnamed protein product [Medioppia subpectinata]CAG2115706.1 unnamed protein product [Medioppia subpectinata]